MVTVRMLERTRRQRILAAGRRAGAGLRRAAAQLVDAEDLPYVWYVAGVALIVRGVALLSEPHAWIVAGLACVLVAAFQLRGDAGRGRAEE